MIFLPVVVVAAIGEDWLGYVNELSYFSKTKNSQQTLIISAESQLKNIIVIAAIGG